MRVRCLAGFAFGVLASGAATAATLQPLSGDVMWSRGGAFQTATAPVEVQPGDFVFVKPGGSAKLSYSASCALPIAPGAVATVSATAPCPANQQNNPANQVSQPGRPSDGMSGQSTGGNQQGQGGGGGGGAGGIAGVGEGGLGGLTTTQMVVGGLVVGGIVAGVAAANASSSHSP